jgi:hypothetical protein
LNRDRLSVVNRSIGALHAVVPTCARASEFGREVTQSDLFWGEALYFAAVRHSAKKVASPRDELLDGLRGSAGDFLDRGGHAVIPILAM